MYDISITIHKDDGKNPIETVTLSWPNSIAWTEEFIRAVRSAGFDVTAIQRQSVEVFPK